ncbi:MAG: DUF4394 domain-containing protein [Burkholderiales bacterium]|nr:MAG: DUF4394 domain-containing protein [Burkholderiales bacterium]
MYQSAKNSRSFSPVRRSAFALAAVSLAILAGCASTPSEPMGQARAEKAVAVTASHQLIKFNAGQPQKILATVAIKGLEPGETILGIDYRVSKDTLYALGSSGRLYTLNEDTAQLTQVGSGSFAVKLDGTMFGFDFNPTVDRIRVISNTGQNLRLHPDTGAVVDSNPNVEGVQIDGPLTYAPNDANVGKKPSIVGAAYSYNKADPKITTNYALDAATGALVTQGSREGTTPAVSPNTGQLFTVGKLGVNFDDAAFDIQALSDVAFAALNGKELKGTRLYTLDLKTGAAQFIGTIGTSEGIRAMAMEP